MYRLHNLIKLFRETLSPAAMRERAEFDSWAYAMARSDPERKTGYPDPNNPRKILFRTCLPRPTAVTLTFDVVRVLLTGGACAILGHKLLDCSTTGPDSGNMDHYCTRCGGYWHIPLY